MVCMINVFMTSITITRGTANQPGLHVELGSLVVVRVKQQNPF